MEEGVLGLRDLHTMNEALLMKFLWRLAVGSETLWAKIVKVKYMPRSNLWHSKRDYRCTAFWKSLMNLWEQLKPWVHWKLGNGGLCNVLAQPWFQGALDYCPNEEGQRNMRVIELLDTQTDNWDLEKLIQIFGYINCMKILANVDPPIPGAALDRLLFKYSTNGLFSVKAGYNILKGTGNVISNRGKKLWETVWKKGDVVPRLRLFLWKLLHRALPLASILHRRFPTHNPKCATCGGQDETVTHLVHLCPFSRACFLASPLGLRTDELSVNFEEALLQVSDKLDEEQWMVYVNSVWALWRYRNDQAYSGKQPNLQLFFNYLSSISRESTIGATSKAPITVAISEIHNEYNCYSDGSWVDGWCGGIGVVVWYKEEMILYKSKAVKGCCPLQVEALALKESVQIAIGLGIEVGSFHSDCLQLVNICSNSQPPLNAEWTAFQEILEVWYLLQEHKSFTCVHIQRSQNDLADNLAKRGRENGWDYVGHTFPCFRF